jgi:hypothetical protein
MTKIEDNDAAQSLLFNGLSKFICFSLIFIFNRFVCIENTTTDFQNAFNIRGSLNSQDGNGTDEGIDSGDDGHHEKNHKNSRGGPRGMLSQDDNGNPAGRNQ